MLLLWGSQPKYFDSSLQGVVEFSGVILSIDRLVTMVAAVVVFLVLHLLATRTRIGKSVLATAQNPEAARIIGIPVDRVRLMAFAVGAGWRDSAVCCGGRSTP